MENMRLAVIEGAANCQMLGRLYSAGCAAESVVVNLFPVDQIFKATGFLIHSVSTR